jgi:uridine kinase
MEKVDVLIVEGIYAFNIFLSQRFNTAAFLPIDLGMSKEMMPEYVSNGFYATYLERYMGLGSGEGKLHILKLHVHVRKEVVLGIRIMRDINEKRCMEAFKDGSKCDRLLKIIELHNVLVTGPAEKNADITIPRGSFNEKVVESVTKGILGFFKYDTKDYKYKSFLDMIREKNPEAMFDHDEVVRKGAEQLAKIEAQKPKNKD